MFTRQKLTRVRFVPCKQGYRNHVLTKGNKCLLPGCRVFFVSLPHVRKRFNTFLWVVTHYSLYFSALNDCILRACNQMGTFFYSTPGLLFCFHPSRQQNSHDFFYGGHTIKSGLYISEGLHSSSVLSIGSLMGKYGFDQQG